MLHHILYKTVMLPVAIAGSFGVLTWSGCKSDVVSGTLQLKLEESVGEQNLMFDNLIYECEAGHAYSVITLKYYLSRIQIRSMSGDLIDLTDVIYRDAR